MQASGIPQDWPFLTAEIPGVGGEIKVQAGDFVVEELPLYSPSGSGTHVYFGIEKQGLTTLAAVERIARALGKQPREIGYAGLKDAQAVTRQTLSVEHVDPGTVEALEIPRLRVLWVDRHKNKLKLGHLRGNRFTIRLRGPGDEAVAPVEAILAELTRRGVPNYFGPQRFGARGDNAEIGLAMLRGEVVEALRHLVGAPGPRDRDDVLRARELFEEGRHAEAADAWPGAFRDQIRVCRVLARSPENAFKAWCAIQHPLRRLYLSAAQSQLFNDILARRIGELDQLWVGDLAWKHVNGACFRVEDAAVEQPRCAAWEISPTGPLFGKRMTAPTGVPGEQEAAVLAGAGLTSVSWAVPGGTKLPGARRPLRVPLGDPQVSAGGDSEGDFLELKFSLPAGSYATSVTRELSKSAVVVD